MSGTKRIVSIADGLNQAETSINNVLDKIQSLDDLEFPTFKEKVEYFAKELSCYLFFNQDIEELKKDPQVQDDLSAMEDILEEITQFLAKIGALYVKITDFDKDGRPILDLSRARFVEVNGKWTLSLDDILDHDDVQVIEGKINAFAAAVKEGDTGSAVTIAIESIIGVVQYSLSIYKDIKDMSISKAFADIFATLKNYPNTVSKKFRFKTVPALATSLVFTGIMLFIWIGISKIPHASTHDAISDLLHNDFVKSQIESTVNLITRAIQGEDMRGLKICGCIPLCCPGDAELQEANEKLQDDLDALIAGTEVNTKPPPVAHGETESKVESDAETKDE